MGTIRPSRSAEELRRDSQTLIYEFDALSEIAETLENSALDSTRVIRNALIESFAIHCRALTWFFFGSYEKTGEEQWSSCRTTDVIAHDFFSAPEDWARIGPSINETLKAAKRQADKQVAHITEDRRGLNRDPNLVADWDIRAVAISLADTMETFIASISAETIAQDVKEQAERQIARIRQLKQPDTGFNAGPNSGDLNPKLMAAMQPKTNIRTVGPEGFSMSARTEPPLPPCSD